MLRYVNSVSPTAERPLEAFIMNYNHDTVPVIAVMSLIT